MDELDNSTNEFSESSNDCDNDINNESEQEYSENEEFTNENYEFYSLELKNKENNNINRNDSQKVDIGENFDTRINTNFPKQIIDIQDNRKENDLVETIDLLNLDTNNQFENSIDNRDRNQRSQVINPKINGKNIKLEEIFIQNIEETIKNYNKNLLDNNNNNFNRTDNKNLKKVDIETLTRLINYQKDLVSRAKLVTTMVGLDFDNVEKTFQLDLSKYTYSPFDKDLKEIKMSIDIDAFNFYSLGLSCIENLFHKEDFILNCFFSFNEQHQLQLKDQKINFTGISKKLVNLPQLNSFKVASHPIGEILGRFKLHLLFPCVVDQSITENQMEKSFKKNRSLIGINVDDFSMNNKSIINLVEYNVVNNENSEPKFIKEFIITDFNGFNINTKLPNNQISSVNGGDYNYINLNSDEKDMNLVLNAQLKNNKTIITSNNIIFNEERKNLMKSNNKNSEFYIDYSDEENNYLTNEYNWNYTPNQFKLDSKTVRLSKLTDLHLKVFFDFIYSVAFKCMYFDLGEMNRMSTVPESIDLYTNIKTSSSSNQTRRTLTVVPNKGIPLLIKHLKRIYNNIKNYIFYRVVNQVVKGSEKNSIVSKKEFIYGYSLGNFITFISTYGNKCQIQDTSLSIKRSFTSVLPRIFKKNINDGTIQVDKNDFSKDHFNINDEVLYQKTNENEAFIEDENDENEEDEPFHSHPSFIYNIIDPDVRFYLLYSLNENGTTDSGKLYLNCFDKTKLKKEIIFMGILIKYNSLQFSLDLAIELFSNNQFKHLNSTTCLMLTRKSVESFYKVLTNKTELDSNYKETTDRNIYEFGGFYSSMPPKLQKINHISKCILYSTFKSYLVNTTKTSSNQYFNGGSSGDNYGISKLSNPQQLITSSLYDNYTEKNGKKIYTLGGLSNLIDSLFENLDGYISNSFIKQYNSLSKYLKISNNPSTMRLEFKIFPKFLKKFLKNPSLFTSSIYISFEYILIPTKPLNQLLTLMLESYSFLIIRTSITLNYIGKINCKEFDNVMLSKTYLKLFPLRYHQIIFPLYLSMIWLVNAVNGFLSSTINIGYDLILYNLYSILETFTISKSTNIICLPKDSISIIKFYKNQFIYNDNENQEIKDSCFNHGNQLFNDMDFNHYINDLDFKFKNSNQSSSFLLLCGYLSSNDNKIHQLLYNLFTYKIEIEIGTIINETIDKKSNSLLVDLFNYLCISNKFPTFNKLKKQRTINQTKLNHLKSSDKKFSDIYFFKNCINYDLSHSISDYIKIIFLTPVKTVVDKSNLNQNWFINEEKLIMDNEKFSNRYKLRIKNGNNNVHLSPNQLISLEESINYLTINNFEDNYNKHFNIIFGILKSIHPISSHKGNLNEKSNNYQTAINELVKYFVTDKYNSNNFIKNQSQLNNEIRNNNFKIIKTIRNNIIFISSFLMILDHDFILNYQIQLKCFKDFKMDLSNYCYHRYDNDFINKVGLNKLICFGKISKSNYKRNEVGSSIVMVNENHGQYNEYNNYNDNDTSYDGNDINDSYEDDESDETDETDHGDGLDDEDSYEDQEDQEDQEDHEFLPFKHVEYCYNYLDYISHSKQRTFIKGWAMIIHQSSSSSESFFSQSSELNNPINNIFKVFTKRKDDSVFERLVYSTFIDYIKVHFDFVFKIVGSSKMLIYDNQLIVFSKLK